MVAVDMTIWTFGFEPSQCAQDMCDAHLDVSFPEYVQLLVNAAWTDKRFHTKLPPPTADSDELAWLIADVTNYQWFVELAKETQKEYIYRYGRVPEGAAVLSEVLKEIPPLRSRNSVPSAPPQGLPAHLCVKMDDKWSAIINAHRRYYRNAPKDIMTWGQRNPPLWFQSLLRPAEVVNVPTNPPLDDRVATAVMRQRLAEAEENAKIAATGKVPPKKFKKIVDISRLM